MGKNFCVDKRPFPWHSYFLILFCCLKHTLQDSVQIFYRLFPRLPLRERWPPDWALFTTNGTNLIATWGWSHSTVAQSWAGPLPAPFLLWLWFCEWLAPLTYYALLTDEWSFHEMSEKEQGKSIPGRGTSTSEVSVAEGSGFMWRLDNANVVRDLKTRVICWEMEWVGSEKSRSWITQGLLCGQVRGSAFILRVLEAISRGDRWKKHDKILFWKY